MVDLRKHRIKFKRVLRGRIVCICTCGRAFPATPFGSSPAAFAHLPNRRGA